MSAAARARLEATLKGARVPLYGSVELTWKCNFACIHCYQEGLRDRHRDLDTAGWKRLLDEMAEAGCLFLTLTGGDPLVRRDFPEIYAHAHARGFLITVFTNGALVTPELAALFARRPPHSIEVALYGMSEKSYQRITLRKGMFAKVMRAVDLLVEEKLPLTLKAVAMRPIAGELLQMRAFARSKGLGFRWDANISPRLDGNKGSQVEMLSPAEQLGLEEHDIGRLRSFEECTGSRIPGDELLMCGATIHAFNVDPAGGVSGCVLLREPMASAVEHGFAAAWAALEAFSRAKSSSASDSCGTCESRGGCSRCPATSRLEGGELEKPVPYHCELTQLRLERSARKKAS